MKKKWLPLVGATFLVLGVGCQNNAEDTTKESEEVKVEEEASNIVSLDESSFYEKLQSENIEHVHGIGYPGNRNELMIATHNGPIIFKEGSWYEAKENKNDYMGFNAVSDGFYSSGHPGKGSDMPNPLGLVKSTDRGKTLEKLGFQGESDFHYLAVGYESHAIYAVNQQKNSKMGTGVYFSEDAKEWESVQLKGTPDQVSGIATHPSDENVLGITSPKGLFVSNDKGSSFDRVTNEVSVSSVTFMESELIYAKDNTKLVRQNLDNGEEVEVPMPDEDIQTIDYIAVNPKDKKEIVFHTVGESIYRTTDEGENWTALVKNGEINQ